MPIGMPYYLEKGPTLRLMEQFINSDPRGTLQTLCDDTASVEKWLLGLKLWDDKRLKDRNTAVGIVRDWFGLVQGGQGGPWKRPPTETTTGYWTAYRGRVDEIVRRTLCWSLQIAIGCDEKGQPKAAAGAAPTRPWPIELFWVCAADWFEGWVISRPIAEAMPDKSTAKKNTGRGLVTVIFVTPAHRGSVVARSPLAVAPTANDPHWPHPVPSTQADYEKISPPPPHPQNVQPQPPRDRRFATWVVTHARHRSYDVASAPVTKNTVETTYGFVPAPLGAVYSGYPESGKTAEPVVVVAPSMPSGGIRADGTV